MKTIKKTVTVLITAILFMSCSTVDVATQTKNAYINSSILTMGAMMVGMMPNADDAQLGKLVDDFLAKKPEIDTKISSNPKLLKAFETNAVALKAIEITSTAQLPSGFKPLTENLTKEDFIAYFKILKTAKPGEEPTDEAGKYIFKMTEWMMELSQTEPFTELNKK